MLFETSDGNGWLIREFARAAAHPLCSSVFMDVHKFMPNTSDMMIFKNAGMSGLSFAFGSGLAYYHTPEDTPQNLDQRSLQHHGENALATARHFGRLDLEQTKHDDVIFASILNRVVLSHLKMWALPLSFAALALFLTVVFGLLRAARINLFDLLLGFGVFTGTIVASLLAVGTLFLLGNCLSVIREIFTRLRSPG